MPCAPITWIAPPLPRFTRQDLATILDEVLEEFRLMTPDCPVHYRPVESPLWIRADAALIKMALHNVLDNAAEYRSPATPEAVVTVELTGMPERLTILVSNPIDASLPMDRERLFDRHVRGHMPTDRDGLGLGLYLVRRILQEHGGEAMMADAADDCFAIRFYLPRMMQDPTVEA
jgi:nitrogen fixation/metabolism regulation signal transduction histidine kinase